MSADLTPPVPVPPRDQAAIPAVPARTEQAGNAAAPCDMRTRQAATCAYAEATAPASTGPGGTAHTESGVVIVYEDHDLLVVDKPHGLVVHPAYRHPDGTLWDLLTPLFADRGTAERPRLLHRLDRDTSGLLCVPKRIAAHRFLERTLQANRFEKGYLALGDGHPPDPGTIDAPLGRAPEDRRRVVVREDGKAARTHYRTLRRLPGHALLRVWLETGRTHQIRAHLAHIGHPLAGDPLYNPTSTAAPRLFLHADRLAFPHPDGRRMVRCRSPLPPELRLALCRLG